MGFSDAGELLRHKRAGLTRRRGGFWTRLVISHYITDFFIFLAILICVSRSQSGMGSPRKNLG